MGCNCNKGKTTPLTPKTPKPQPTPQTGQSTTQTHNQRTASTRTQSFVLDQGGTTQTFGSRLEAEAERVRRGGVIRPA